MKKYLILLVLVLLSCSEEEYPEEVESLVIDCKCDYVTTEIVIKTTRGENRNTSEKISEIELSRVSDPTPNCLEEKIKESTKLELESHWNEDPAYSLDIYTHLTYHCYGEPNIEANYGCEMWVSAMTATGGEAYVEEYRIYFGNNEAEYTLEVNKKTYDYYSSKDGGSKICWEGRKG